MNLDCAIIVSAHRQELVRDHVLPSVLRQGCFDEVMVVGDYWHGRGYRYLPVPAFHGNTLDALTKRQEAFEESTADAILYLCDDHRLLNIWDTEWSAWKDAQWDVLVPARYTQGAGRLVEINNGLDRRDPEAPYAGGHAAIFRRRALARHPWNQTYLHDRCWDLLHSRAILADGGVIAHCADLRVCDIDPNPAEKPRHFTLSSLSGETP